MSEPDPPPKLRVTKKVNGSGLPEDTSGEANSDERKEKENGVRTVGDEEGKEEMKDDSLRMAESEDTKMAVAEDSKIVEVEDSEMAEAEGLKMTNFKYSKMVEAEDLKDAEKGGKVEDDEECKKTEEDNDVREERNGADMEKKVEENKDAKGLNKKHVRGQKVGEANEKKEVGMKAKELSSTPAASSIDRPVRERKTVERLVESLENEPVKKILIEKGRGTPLKDIPNVAYKLAKKQPADLRLLHQTLYGRIGKVVDFKNHILQFSGFVWHENEDKQKTKIKEKLDKCVKGTLMDLCDLFDLSFSKATTRKEELVAMLLDFMMVPHVTTDVIIAEKEQQSTKSRKRKSVTEGSASKSLGGVPLKWARKKRTKSEITPKVEGKGVHEAEGEEGENENGVPDEDGIPKHSESEEKENKSDEVAEEDKDDDDFRKGKLDMKKSSKRRGSAGTKQSKAVASPPKVPLPITPKSPTKTSFSRYSKAEENKNIGSKVFSRKVKNVDAPRNKSTPKTDHKEKATGDKMAKVKAKSEEAESSDPSKEELRNTICEILKKVDFNTATFADILKELGSHYGVDLTPRKAVLKHIVEEELTKLADEAEEDEHIEDDEGDSEKDESPGATGKEVEA